MTVDLDDSQLAVVEADPDERLLVIAGAGRGKTEVVAARIDALVADHGLQPVDEVLVLTFSRAAVAAADRRVRAKTGAAVGISTFDSFASQLLVEAGEDPSEIRGFDARIRAATDVLRRISLPQTDMLRHLLLDEVQDLVGDRAEFAAAVLGRLDPECGFTALGDPLQAIYDWQLDNSKTQTTSHDLMTRLVADFGARRVELEVDYRARGRDPRAIVDLGNLLRAVPAEDPAPEDLLMDFVDDLIDVGPVENVTNLVDRPPATTAVLCRANGDALAVARALREHSVRHVLRRPLEEVGAAAWIARALGDVDDSVLDRDEVFERLACAAVEMDHDDAWVALKTAERDGHNRTQLRLSGLRRALRNQALPQELVTRDEAAVVVSTIHRAKGLEFDRVFVVDPSYRHDDEDTWAELRTQFVALSRARDELLRCQAPSSARRISHHWSGRWAAYTLRRNGRWPWAMEVTSRDIDVIRPATHESGSGVKAQARLADPHLPRAEVDGVLEEGTPVECPRYELRVKADGTVIGRTSEQFGTDLVRVFGRRRHGQDWPRHIRDMAVTSVETVAGEPDLSRAADLPGSGLWLVPRLTGLARPAWRDEEQE
ncbi:UvrD-helicase domain-containing protein [Geodermatophilus sp. SYSU D00703]